MKKFILRARYTANEFDDFVIVSKQDIDKAFVEDTIEEVRNECDEIVWHEVILERISEIYDIEVVDLSKLDVFEY